MNSDSSHTPRPTSIGKPAALEWAIDLVGAALLVVGVGGLVWLDAVNGTLRAGVTSSTITWFLVAFAGFVVLLRVQVGRISFDWRYLLAVGLLLRIALFFTEPTLSDDVYRYLWEGHIVTQGVSPYSFPIDSPLGDPLNIRARELANNTSLASPYLPVAHAIFALAAWVLPSEPLSMQIVMVAFETLGATMIMRLLTATGLPPRRVLIYWLNPLVIVEIAHGAHLDALIIGLGFTGLWLTFDKARSSPAAAIAAPIVFAAATLTRPLALLFVSVLFWVWNWRQRLLYGAVVLIPIAIAGAWVGLGLTADDGVGVFGSVRAYSETFRFNSGIYHWSERWISSQGLDDRGWNEPINLTRLVIFAVVAVAMLGVFVRASRVQELRGQVRLLAAPMMIYVLLTPVLHPWYVLLLLALVPLLAPGADERTRDWGRLVPWLALSALLIFSYLTYEDPNFFAEREWIRRLEWFPTLGLFAVVALSRIGLTSPPKNRAETNATR